EDNGREDRRGGRVKVHNVGHFEPRQGAGKQRWNDGEVFRNVVCNGKGCECTASHEELFSDFHHFDQLCRIAVQVNHVGGFLGGLCPGVHGQRDVGLGKGWGVICAVPHHCNQFSPHLLLFDVRKLCFRRRLGEAVI